MKKLLVLSGILFPMLSFCQPLHINLFGGFSNYQGDLQDKQFTMSQANAAFGLGAEYDLTRHFSLRGGFVVAKVSSDDKNNKQADLVARNLNFTSNITEGNLVVVYNLLDQNRYRITPYVFGGIAVYHFNPYTRDTLGNRFYLKGLSTEGQGLTEYPDRKPYNLTQFAIPFGGGIKFRITDNVQIAYEIGLRKLFTDYLDDVSTDYIDQGILLAQKGTKAVELAYRGGELKDGNTIYPADGTIRGGSKFKDWYYFSGISLSIGINGGRASHRHSNSRSRGSTDCPPKVL